MPSAEHASTHLKRPARSFSCSSADGSLPLGSASSSLSCAGRRRRAARGGVRRRGITLQMRAGYETMSECAADAPRGGGGGGGGEISSPANRPLAATPPPFLPLAARRSAHATQKPSSDRCRARQVLSSNNPNAAPEESGTPRRATCVCFLATASAGLAPISGAGRRAGGPAHRSGRQLRRTERGMSASAGRRAPGALPERRKAMIGRGALCALCGAAGAGGAPGTRGCSAAAAPAGCSSRG